MSKGSRKGTHKAKGRASAKALPLGAMVVGASAVKYKTGLTSSLRGSMTSPGKFTSAQFLDYDPGKGVGPFVKKIRRATPMQLVDFERRGVGGRLLKDIATEMEIPKHRFFKMIGVAKATAEKKASSNQLMTGSGGRAALGVARLLGIAQSIVDNSMATEARGFDAATWLGQWIDRPQPALAGRKPADLLDTPTGVEIVARLLGAIESGAYL